MKAIESNKEPQALEEWERHYLTHMDMTLDEKRDEQFNDLVHVLENFQLHFESIFLLALKNTEGEKLKEDELKLLRQSEDARTLVQRISGLKKVFGPVFYSALEKVVGADVVGTKNVDGDTTEAKEDAAAEASSSGAQTLRVPKGFNRWDLKQIKLNESYPDRNKRKWVEYWTLKGESAVGEILYNDDRDLYYFRPFDTARKSTFPLTEMRARKASREGKSYYFKKTVPPAGVI